MNAKKAGGCGHQKTKKKVIRACRGVVEIDKARETVAW